VPVDLVHMVQVVVEVVLVRQPVDVVVMVVTEL
jgi:hypothetical protein